MSRATPLVTCSLPVVCVCLSIRLETKPRGSIDGPTSTDKNLSRQPFIHVTETNLFRFISTLILSAPLSPSSPAWVFPYVFVALSEGTRNHLSNQGLSHLGIYIRLWRIFEGKIRKIGNCEVTSEMPRSK